MESMTKQELMRKIQAYSFAKTEAELFLDGHPGCSAALEYYRDVLEKLASFASEYEDKYGPLTAAGGAMGDGWSWVETPWPWQKEEE